eukprot:g25078.t1
MLPQNCIEYLAPDGDFGQYIARLAIVGATCFCGAVCRVNSVVVTVFELIAVPRLILPASARALQSVRKILDPTMMSLCLPRRAQRTDFTRLHFIKKSREDEGDSTARSDCGPSLVPRMIPIVDEVKTGGEPRLVLLGAVTWEDLDALQVAGGEDMLVSAAKLGKILQDPLRINPHISLKKAYIESQSVPRKGVNCLAWSRDGSLLASGSDDTCLCIWSYSLRMRLKLCLKTGHAANIFGVAFLANEPLVSTCSVDGTVRLMDIAAERCASVWRAHTRGANKVVTTCEEPNLVTSCGGDGKVRQHDRRVRRPDLLLDWDLRWDGTRLGVAGAEINSMTSCTLRPDLLALAGDDPFLWLYDRRKLGSTCEPLAVFRPEGMPLAPSASVTGVALSPDGRRLLGSWQRQDAFQFSTEMGQARPALRPETWMD